MDHQDKMPLDRIEEKINEVCMRVVRLETLFEGNGYVRVGVCEQYNQSHQRDIADTRGMVKGLSNRLWGVLVAAAIALFSAVVGLVKE